MANQHHTALRLAVEIAGSQRKLAAICGCSKQNIHEAMKHGRGLPARYAIKVEERLGISRHVTRPDVFGPLPGNGTQRAPPAG